MAKAPKVHVYYDVKTGRICAVCGGPNPSFTDYILVDEEDVMDLFADGVRFSDYVVGYVKKPGQRKKLTVMLRADQETFKNAFVEYIETTNIKDPELTVAWHPDHWSIALSETSKTDDQYNLIPGLVFFVNLKNDRDHIVRTITVSMPELVEKSHVDISFISTAEQCIDDIAISTKPIFESCGLVIND